MHAGYHHHKLLFPRISAGAAVNRDLLSQGWDGLQVRALMAMPLIAGMEGELSTLGALQEYSRELWEPSGDPRNIPGSSRNIPGNPMNT